MNTSDTNDRAAIEALAVSYADAIRERDYAAVRDLWTSEGAVWTVPGADELRGLDAIIAGLQEMQANYEAIVHVPHCAAIYITGDAAEARWYVSELGRLTDGRGSQLIGTYDDSLVCERSTSAPRWRFRSRVFTLLYLGQPEVAGRFY